jgi:hypothetical protein
VSLLVVATLLSVALIAFGAVALAFHRPRAAVPDDAGEPIAQGDTRAAAGGASDAVKTPVARLKAVVRARDWRRALPSLLVIAGLLGVMVFGSLAMLFVFGHAFAGISALAVTAYAIGRLAIDYARA